MLPKVVTPLTPLGIADHVKSGLAVEVDNVTVLKSSPEQMVCDAGEKETVGDGLIVTSTINTSPAQEFVVDGSTVYDAVTGSIVVFPSVCEMISTGLFCADPPENPEPEGAVHV